MQNFNLEIFRRVFSQTTNDFSVAGSRLMSDGSGDTNFRAALFLDNMNGALVNKHNWRVTTIGTCTVTPVKGHCIRLSRAAGGAQGDYAEIKLKGSYGRINETGMIVFSLNILGSTKGGQGILTGTNNDECMFFGMKFDSANYVGIVSRDNNSAGADEKYYLVTCFNGVETKSASFVIPNEDLPDHLIELYMSLDNVDLFYDNSLVLSNTTNIPNNAELRPYVRVTHGAMGNDSKIDVDYIKIQQ